MIISGVVIAGAATAGTLGASIKAYREEKRKKEFPWTVAAERMAKNKFSLVKKRRKSQFGAEPKIIDHVISNIRQVQAKSASLREEIIAPFVGEKRKGQLAEIAGNGSDENPMEKESKLGSAAAGTCSSLQPVYYLFQRALSSMPPYMCPALRESFTLILYC